MANSAYQLPCDPNSGSAFPVSLPCIEFFINRPIRTPSALPTPASLIHWLFLDPVNVDVAPHGSELPGHDWLHVKAEAFVRYVLLQELKFWFDFSPKMSTLKLWIVRLPSPLFALRSKFPLLPIRLRDVDTGWAAKNAANFDPAGVAMTPRHMNPTINRFLGGGEPMEERPEELVHLIITAKRQELYHPGSRGGDAQVRPRR